eukprot:9488382-Pyramimonas_sp.AAC.1
MRAAAGVPPAGPDPVLEVRRLQGQGNGATKPLIGCAALPHPPPRPPPCPRAPGQDSGCHRPKRRHT